MYARAFTFPTLTTEHPVERLVMRALLGVVLLLAFSYVYFIAASTFHIIARKQAESSSIAVQSVLAQTNAEYYALASGLTEGRAAALGLHPLDEKEYVSRAVYLGYADTRAR